MPNEWINVSILYQATIKCNDSKYKHKIYKGICETTFNKHDANHKKSFNLIKSENGTTLSIGYWILKQRQQAPRLTWEIEGWYKAYNSTLKKCNLYLNEKLAIIDDPHKNLVSSNLSMPQLKQVYTGKPHVTLNTK